MLPTGPHTGDEPALPTLHGKHATFHLLPCMYDPSADRIERLRQQCARLAPDVLVLEICPSRLARLVRIVKPPEWPTVAWWLDALRNAMVAGAVAVALEAALSNVRLDLGLEMLAAMDYASRNRVRLVAGDRSLQVCAHPPSADAVSAVLSHVAARSQVSIQRGTHAAGPAQLLGIMYRAIAGGAACAAGTGTEHLDGHARLIMRAAAGSTSLRTALLTERTQYLRTSMRLLDRPGTGVVVVVAGAFVLGGVAQDWPSPPHDRATLSCSLPTAGTCTHCGIAALRTNAQPSRPQACDGSCRRG